MSAQSALDGKGKGSCTGRRACMMILLLCQDFLALLEREIYIGIYIGYDITH